MPISLLIIIRVLKTCIKYLSIRKGTDGEIMMEILGYIRTEYLMKVLRLKMYMFIRYMGRELTDCQ